jgi:alpha-1,4-digalacturonate transport system substrate-binding protein
VTRLSRLRWLCAWLATVVSLGGGAAAREITVQHIDADVKLLVDKFVAENPGTKVNFRLVSFQSILESLPVQLATGRGPDISMVADWGGLAKYYLDLRPYVDAAYFEREFGTLLAPMRGEDRTSNAINGMSGSMTLNGAFVNLTLFKQAGVPVPKAGATWDEWALAARKVARATRIEIPMEMDRSGHRFASLAISYGAKLLDDKGNPVVDEGLKTAIRKFVSWHRDGTMPMDLWGAVGGATHRDNFQDFMNGKVVFYFGGSWSIYKMDGAVGDLFDWAVVDAPCGTSSCTLMPGGGAMVAFKHTRHPELAAAFLSFLARESTMREAIARHPGIPVASTLVETGVAYPGASERVRDALESFRRQVPHIPKAAYDFQGWRYQRAAMNALTTRISQVLTHELDVDGAAAYIKKDVELAIQAARQ